MQALLEGLFTALQEFLEWLFNFIFGEWNYHVLFNWLPSDIIAAVNFIIVFLFGLAVLKWIKSLLPI